LDSLSAQGFFCSLHIPSYCAELLSSASDVTQIPAQHCTDSNHLGNLRKPHATSQQHFLGQAEMIPYPQDDVVHLGLFSRNLWNKGKES